MALADTAKLVAALSLEDKGFTSGLRNADRSLGNFQAGLAQTGRGMGQLAGGVGRVATNLLKFGVAGATALGGFLGLQLKAGTEQVHLLELATARTQAVLASTKGVAGQTADSIRDLSEKYEGLNATIDDKVIQSGANLLLSFTNIRGKAFEPALKAALDLNQAMGGGEEGLQGNLIKVAKALNDPVKGLGLLGRVGITFTAQEQKKIRALVESNHLYDAQALILDKLSVKFGGQFAAAGNTAAGRVAALHDNIQDLQRTFAGPFSGVLDRIVGKLGTFLGETGTVDTVRRLGESIAGLFTDERIDRGIGILRQGLDLLSSANLSRIGAGVKGAFDFVKSIDFKTIGEGLKITAGVAKTAIDAFLSLPKEAQAIVIGALAANKLSGGLLASGLGNVAGGLLKLALGSLRTITATNVTVIGANVTDVGGGVAGAAGAAGGGALSLGAIIAGFGVALVGDLAFGQVAAEINKHVNPASFNFNEVAGQSREFSTSTAANLFAQRLADKLGLPLDDVKRGIVHGVQDLGLTFDQAVARLEGTIKQTAAAPTGSAAVLASLKNLPGDLGKILSPLVTAEAANRAKLIAILDKLPFGKTLADLINKGQVSTAPKPKPLTDAQLIAALRQTSEFGKAGVGTTIEHGVLTGTDPFGEQALRLFQQAQFPRQGKTLGEIQRHIIAAEEVQRDLLSESKFGDAIRIQRTIDALHALLGSTDKTPLAISALQREQAARGERLQRLMDPLPGAIDTLNKKDFSPKVDITIPVTNQISVNNVVRAITHYSAAFGTGPGGAVTDF